MAKFEITSPEGRRFEITAPDGTSEDEAIAYAQQQFGGAAEEPKDQDGPLKRGWNKMVQSVGITGALAAGDTESATRRIGEAAQYQAANPGSPEGNELMAAWQRGDGISGGISEVAGEFKKDWRDAPSTIAALRGTGKNMLAMGAGVVEQTPNMLIPMAGMIGGGLAGSTAGPVGTVGGAWAGASTGNALVEGGGMAQEALHKAGINPNDTAAVRAYLDKNGDTLLMQAGIKGAVIGAVDTATMGIGGKLLTAPAKAATGRALLDMGVDITDKAAVKAAMASTDLAARVAVDPIYRAATTGGRGLARNATVAAMEPAGEFTGEYLGQGLATGEYNEKDAFLEAASSIGQSGATFAGQKIYAAAKYPFKSEVGAGGTAPADPSGAVPAGDLLDTPSAGTETGVTGGAQQAATEADTALYTPKNLTALDRVNEIDAKLPAATSEESSALQAERDQITASWPKAAPGAETTFTTETGSRLAGQYALMEAGDLTTSHDENLRPTATYPTELQPRARDRHASELQIQGIVGKLDPARLGESADVATGAPIVGADGLVESGNARTIALKRVYQANGMKAETYKQFIRDNAARFGIAPEAIDAMQKPVLVRVRSTPVNRAEFARQANASTVARMSPSEQAKSDAAQIDSLDDLNPDEAGEFMSGSSTPFVRRFLAKLAGTESAGLIDASGRLSQTGYTRIRNAVLAKAYGDSPVLLRMVESLDDNTRNVSKALLRVAPQVAKAREAMGEGALHNVDLIPDLMAAVEELSDLKEKGVSIDQAIAQAGMFGDKISPEARELLAFLDQNIRSPRRIAEFIQSYLDALTAAGNPAQGSMFGDSAAPTKRDLIAAARRTTNGQTESVAGNTEPAQEGRSQSEDARGGQSGTQGNEGARTDQQLIDTLNSLNPQLKTKMTVEWVDESDPRTKNHNGEGGEFIGGHNGSSIILVKGKANRRTLLHEIRHMIDMLLGGYQLRKWLSEDAGMMKRMVSYLRDERKAGRIDKDSRMTDAEETAQSVLDAYYQDKERLREGFPDIVEYLEKMGADKYASLMQEVGAGETANIPTGEWIEFPADSGTLGIPRAEMPQVKGEHRGALIQFLAAKGITHETVELPASELKPTQAEYSTEKVAKWGEKREGVDRSVLASSDGYILDGHHQWVYALGAGETEQVIRFSAPIRELLAATFQFPSVRQSEGGNVTALRSKARQDFKDALGDLATIASKHTRAAMLPENTPNLMPTLIKLSGAAIAEVGYQIKDIIAHVKQALRSNEEFKKFWNKIDNAIYRKAAEKAAEKASLARVDDLFSMAEERKGQVDLFSQPPAKKAVDPQSWEERSKGNYKPPALDAIVPADVATRVRAMIAKWQDNLPEASISAEDRVKAEALLEPVIAAAKKDEPAFDARVREIGRQFLGSQLGPTKKIGRAAVKLVEEDFDLSKMKDIVRATIVVSSYDMAQSVIDAIADKFEITQINNKSALAIRAPAGVKLTPKGVTPEGYSDVTAFVRLPGGGIAEIQINIPEMLSAKLSAHVLYEGARVVEDDPARQGEYAELRDGQRDVYQAALDSSLTRLASATDFKKYASSELQHLEAGPLVSSGSRSGTSSTASSSSLNHLPSGNLTNSVPPNDDANLQPSGNLSGTFISSTPFNDSIAKPGAEVYTDGKEKSSGDENGQNGDTGSGGAQGQGAGPASPTGGPGPSAGVRDGAGGRDQRPDRDADNGTGAEAGAQQGQEPAGGSRDPQGVRGDGDEWANAYTPLFKRTAAFPAGLSTAKVKEVIDYLVKGLRNPPITKHVSTVADLPFAAPADTAGVFWGGKVWMVAANITSAEHAREVFAHETLGHYGLRGFFGAMLDGALSAIHDRNPRVRLSATEWKARNADVIETYKSKYGMTDADVHALAIEEAMSNWAQERGPIKGALRLAALLQKALRAMGMKAWANSLEAKSNAEALDMLRKARMFVRDGTKLDAPKVDAIYPAMADPTLADDLTRQEKWLDREAKLRGFKSIDDLAEKNYKVFENLAALWRKQNPVEVALMSRKASALRVVDLFGNGSRVQHFDDRRGLFYEAQKYPSGRTGWRAGEVIDGRDYWLSDKEFNGMEEAQSAVRGLRISNTAKQKSANKYGAIPALWTGEAKQVAKAIIDAGIGVERFSASTQSASKYVYLASGLKVRMADHSLPGAYDQPDVDYRYGGDINVLVEEIRQAEEGAPAPDGGELGSRSLGETKMQERPAVRADESGSRAEPAQSGSGAGSNSNVPLFSRAVPPAPTIRHSQPANRTADDIIAKKAGTARPIDAVMKGITQAVRLDRLTMAIYNKGAFLLDRYTPETIKAGLVSDYGIPESVTDMRAVVQGRQKQQTRAAGVLLERLATLTRAEARVAYEWMNTDNPQSSDWFMDQLPPESIKTLAEVEKMIDDLSKEAVALGQLDPEAYKRNRFAYLRRSYAKHEAELTKGETAMRKRAISILGDQYKGRGMTDPAPMRQIQNLAPEWWNRKTVAGKADKQLKGERFIRLERRANVPSQVTAPLVTTQGPVQPGAKGTTPKGKLLEIAYWPASEPMPASYGSWDQAGTWEVIDTKGADLIMWRDFTKQERVALGEIDEVRYAIAKTLHGMIHDVETGKYLQWLAQNHGKKEGEKFDGTIVEASDRMRDVFKPGEWVQVPDTVIPGTRVKKYGTLAGRYLPGPIWNDVRQVVGFRFQPLGETYAKIHRAWKTSKTALSPAVHMNNVMANFVMSDWHDVTAGHILKALKLMMSNDPAAAEVIARFSDSGGSIGTWAAKELQQDQMRPIIEALEKELGLAGNIAGQVGVMSALQLALKGQFPSAWEALKPSTPGKAAVAAARAMIDMYEAEDQVFRLAAWLRAKESGATDLAAGKLARKSFLDYSINAPWVQMLRSTALPFVAFTYRAVPMLMETAAKKPWKLMKLGMLAGAINAMGYMLSGGDEDDERKLLPEEKAGRVWGIVPKLIRMPWNDANGSPVFADIRRYVPVGDVFDVGQSHSALPMLPGMTPGGPLAVLAELALNKVQFTGKDIRLETDTTAEGAAKVADHLYKAFAPNIILLPGTYAFTGAMNAGTGKTDTFGREQSLAQAVASSVGVKVASYPKDVLQLNAQREAQFKMMEIERNITALKREYQKKGLTADEFQAKAADQMAKKRKVMEDLQKKAGG